MSGDDKRKIACPSPCRKSGPDKGYVVNNENKRLYKCRQCKGKTWIYASQK